MKIWNGTDYTEYPGTPYATQADLDADEAALAAHLADTADAHDAAAVSYAGGTGMSATDVEAAIDELATEKLNTADHDGRDHSTALGTAVLADLSDVAATAPSDGQVLTFDTTNGWQPETSSGGAPTRVGITPGGNLDVTSATMVAWSGTAALTVPEWATTATVMTTINGVFGAAGNVVVDVQVRIGSADGARVVQQALANNTRSPIPWSDTVTLAATGVSTIEVRALRSSGSVAVRADTSSDFTFLVWFS